MITNSISEKRYITNLLNRLLTEIHPIEVVLFGSHARNEEKKESDIDIMIVMPEGTHCLRTAKGLYKNFIGFEYPVDIIVTTPSKLETHKNNVSLIYHTILKEGVRIYG